MDFSYFTLKTVADNVWAITGPVGYIMYLATGSQKSMLVDTGMGIGDLAGLVKTLTDKPVIVVNTHGHPDHAGGNSSFGSVWMSPKDMPIRAEMCTYEYRRNDIKAASALGEDNPEFVRLAQALVPDASYQAESIEPGQVFDLGDRQYEVLGVPGHTPGCICLLNSRDKILFTGDSILATPAWLYTRHSLPLSVYMNGLKRIQARQEEFELLFPGHHPTPVTRQHLADLIECCERILANPQEGIPTKTFAGEGLLWEHKNVSIIYNPERL